MRKFIIGSKYFLKDKVLNDIVEAEITKTSDTHTSFTNLDNYITFTRKNDEIEIASIIKSSDFSSENEIFSIQTDLVKAIIGRDEVVQYSKDDFKELNIDENTVLISITDPDRDLISEDILSKFKSHLSIQFWDIEKDLEINKYKSIEIDEARTIKEYIMNHKNDNFIVHCEAGMSRSAAVGLAIFYLIEHNEDRYLFQTSPNPIKAHRRYHPNWTVFDMIADS